MADRHSHDTAYLSKSLRTTLQQTHQQLKKRTMAQNNRNQSPAIFNRPFQKLGGILPRKAAPPKFFLRNLYLIGEDGVDHININFNGMTDLGHALHQNAKLAFIHDLFGRFLTVEGFYRWLASETGDDQFRTLNGIQCSHYAKKTINRGYIANLRFLVVDATWQKVCTYPDLRKALGESELPFDSYYYVHDDVNGKQSNTRMRYKNALWVCEGLEEMRDAIRAGTEPDFSFLMDDQQEYDKMVRIAKKAVMPEKPAPVAKVEEKDPTEKPKEKLIPNPPGTGKKFLARQRRLAREAEEQLQAASSILISTQPVIADSEVKVGRGLTSSINIVDEAPFQQHIADPEVALVAGVGDEFVKRSGMAKPGDEMISLETNADMSNVADFPHAFVSPEHAVVIGGSGSAASVSIDQLVNRISVEAKEMILFLQASSDDTETKRSILSSLLKEDMNTFMQLPQEGLVKEVFDAAIGKAVTLSASTPVTMDELVEDIEKVDQIIRDKLDEQGLEVREETVTEEAPVSPQFGGFGLPSQKSFEAGVSPAFPGTISTE